MKVQFSRLVVSDSLWPHEPQHARPPCPSPTPGVHPNPLWRLILCINLIGLGDAQVAGKTFLGVPVKVFLAEIHFELMSWVKQTFLTYMSGHHSIHWGPPWNRRQRKGQFLFSELRCPSSLALRHQCSLPLAFKLLSDLHHQFPAFSGLWSWTELYHRLSWFSGSSQQTEMSQPPWSCEPIPIKKKKICFICVCDHTHLSSALRTNAENSGTPCLDFSSGELWANK